VQAVRGGFGEVATPKHGENPSIREDRMQKALWGESHLSGTSYRGTQPECWYAGSQATRMTRKIIQVGDREVATAKHGQNSSNCWSSLRVPLSPDRECL
jgi:hypothetical protein